MLKIYVLDKQCSKFLCLFHGSVSMAGNLHRGACFPWISESSCGIRFKFHCPTCRILPERLMSFCLFKAAVKLGMLRTPLSEP